MDQNAEIDCLLQTLLDIAKQVSEGKITLYEHNECFTSGAFDSVVCKINDSSIEYALLQKVLGQYRSLKEMQRTVYLELLYSLIISSNTTEIPEGIEEIIKENASNATITSIKEWYRIQ